MAADAACDSTWAIACTAALGVGDGVVLVVVVGRVGSCIEEHCGGFATSIEMFPIAEQWSGSAQETSEYWEMPKPAGSDPAIHVRPPSVVLAATPAVQLSTPIASLVP